MSHEGDNKAATPCSTSNTKPSPNGSNQHGELDPLRHYDPRNTIQDGDHFVLVFNDGRYFFGECMKRRKGGKWSVKILKKSYSTGHLIGLPYGTVLEQSPHKLIPLPPDADLLPPLPAVAIEQQQQQDEEHTNSDPSTTDQQPPPRRDNRFTIDDNTSQGLRQESIKQLQQSGAHGSEIVQQIIANSSTFTTKTGYSQHKYITRKQQKYQPRCRIVRSNAATLTQAMFVREPRKIMNLRPDTLGQILSYANLAAGCRVLCWETNMGIITGSIAERLRGYGSVFSVYSGQQPPFGPILERFNLTFREYASIRYVHAGDLLNDGDKEQGSMEETDLEQQDREKLKWPCELQDHTRNYLENEMSTKKEQVDFLARRQARFARKVTRTTPLEGLALLHSQKVDSLIVVVKYDPTETLLSIWKQLTPSAPFVVFCEFIEPLTKCFLELQRRDLAINLRLSDTWAREYQVLPNRTHPNMSMSQSGGFLLSGTKLDPVTGINEMDEALRIEIRRDIMRPRWGKKKPASAGDSDNKRPADGDVMKSNKKSKTSAT